jgi:hypothetical protein
LSDDAILKKLGHGLASIKTQTFADLVWRKDVAKMKEIASTLEGSEEQLEKLNQYLIFDVFFV